MRIALHTATTWHGNVMSDIRAARSAGYDGIELLEPKVRRYERVGCALAALRELLDDLVPVSIGYVPDIERGGADQRALFEESQQICELASRLNCRMIQVLSGPLAMKSDHPSAALRAMRPTIVRNLRHVAQLAHERQLRVYLEPVTWTPLHRLRDALEIVSEVERANVGLVLDFWHLWSSGCTPEEVAEVDPAFIECVHFSDGVDVWGSRGSVDEAGRDVWPGEGVIPLRDWVDAVKSTGFDGWWSCEVISPRYWESDACDVAAGVKAALTTLC